MSESECEICGEMDYCNVVAHENYTVAEQLEVAKRGFKLWFDRAEIAYGEIREREQTIRDLHLDIDHVNKVVMEKDAEIKRLKDDLEPLNDVIRQVWKLRGMVYQGRDLAKLVMDDDSYRYSLAETILAAVVEKHTTPSGSSGAGKEEK